MSILDIEDLTMSFGGVKALDRLRFSVAKEQIVSLIGPNGAGKTTVFNLLMGTYKPLSGRIWYEGREISGLATWKIAQLGIGRTFQNIRLFPSLTSLENVRIGLTAKIRFSVLGSLIGASGSRGAEKEFDEEAVTILKLVGLDHRAEVLSARLTYGQQRRLELARALALRPRLLLLDEPSAGMPIAETFELMETIKGLVSRGITILLVEHDMRLVMGISDHVVVLDNGRKIAEGRPDQVQANPEVIKAYLGEGEV